MWPRLSPAWSTLVTSNCTTRTPQLGTKAHHCLALQSFGLAPQSRALCAAPTAPLHMHWEPALVVLLHFPHLNLGPPTQPPPGLKCSLSFKSHSHVNSSPAHLLGFSPVLLLGVYQYSAWSMSSVTVSPARLYAPRR